jgi:hypothetical protein
MELKQLGSNMTAIVGANSTVLLSYETPVASMGPLGGMRSESYMPGGGKSVTTQKHITKFFAEYGLERKEVRVVEQEVIERKLANISVAAVEPYSEGEKLA